MLFGQEDRRMGAQCSLLLQEGLQGRAVGLKSRRAQLVPQAHVAVVQKRVLLFEKPLKGEVGIALVALVVPGVANGIHVTLCF